jgi:hypothetical protein
MKPTDKAAAHLESSKTSIWHAFEGALAGCGLTLHEAYKRSALLFLISLLLLTLMMGLLLLSLLTGGITLVVLLSDWLQIDFVVSAGIVAATSALLGVCGIGASAAYLRSKAVKTRNTLMSLNIPTPDKTQLQQERKPYQSSVFSEADSIKEMFENAQEDALKAIDSAGKAGRTVFSVGAWYRVKPELFLIPAFCLGAFGSAYISRKSRHKSSSDNNNLSPKDDSLDKSNSERASTQKVKENSLMNAASAFVISYLSRKASEHVKRKFSEISKGACEKPSEHSRDKPLDPSPTKDKRHYSNPRDSSSQVEAV